MIVVAEAASVVVEVGFLTEEVGSEVDEVAALAIAGDTEGIEEALGEALIVVVVAVAVVCCLVFAMR